MGSEIDFDCLEAEAKSKKGKISLKDLKKHVCPFAGCQSSFNRPWKLSRHINTHTKQRPFKCDFAGCSKDYSNKSHLDRHKCVSHSLNKPVPVYIPCPYPNCNKIFANKWSLKRHCKTHKNKDCYKCTQCDTIFKKCKQLKQHIQAHMGIKPFVCETCKESFETQKFLKLHKRKHKIYACEYSECQEQFSTWNSLRKHIKLSHFVLYRCDSCPRTFKNKWTLTEHVFSHLPNDKRDVFACPHNHCTRVYFHHRNLEHHLKSFHQNINYKCEVDNCGQTFVKRMTLKKHQISQHRELKTSKDSLPCSDKVKQPRKPRKDKGQLRKSMAALLSGIILPYKIDKNLAQNNITSEVLEEIQKVKDAFKDNRIQEQENFQGLETFNKGFSY